MINRPVLMKFGAQKRIPTQMAVNSPQFKMFHIRTSATGRQCFGRNSSPDYLILVKFCVRT